MDKKLKAKWVTALRSGRYRQARGELKSASGAYCCLGVLRKIMHPKSVLERNKVDGYLCGKHLKEAGLGADQQYALVAMNDDGESFSEIAAYIEAKL